MDPARGHVVEPLTARQRAVLEVVARYHAATGEACSVLFIARRLAIHHSTAQLHVEALHRKGWLLSASPTGLRCEHVK